MKKIFYLLASAICCGIITSCSSDDQEYGTDQALLVRIASQKLDVIDQSLLKGGWQEEGCFVGASDGTLQSVDTGAGYHPLRFSIGEGFTLTQYVDCYDGLDTGFLKTVRKYHYDDESHQFYIENSMLSNEKYTVDYLSEEFMTLNITSSYGTISKYVLRHVSDSEVQQWEEKYKPEFRGNISSYGAYRGEDYQWYLSGEASLLSAMEFQSVIVGHPLKHLESHQILEDGSIKEVDYYYGMDGGGPSQFLFEDSRYLAITFTVAIPKYGPYIESSYAYTYDESCNRVNCNYPSMTLLSYDEKTEQVQMIIHPYNRLATYQRMPMDWWKELESKCSVVN